MRLDPTFLDDRSAVAEFRRDVLAGLAGSPKRLSPKYFYDDRGSRLFDEICRLPEYYPTRTETVILRSRAEEIAQTVGAGCLLVEPGSGSSDKVRLLLNFLRPEMYIPVDISCSHVRAAANCLVADYPWLRVRPVCTDFNRPGFLPPLPEGRKKVAFFPGSTIGNFEPDQCRRFLHDTARWLGPGGGLLIGVDLKKETSVLNAAYNDPQGVTAAFNLNLLARINCELEGDFDLERFSHFAFFNEALGRVEMHLVSTAAQQVRVAGTRFGFSRYETIHTENSYKYSVTGFRRVARSAGFTPIKTWTDPDELFSIHYFQV